METGTPPGRGRREANKDAVRAALRTAAGELFAAHGYEATTVRQIATAANVTERTFYRYFDGKEGLLAEESLTWVESLEQAIGDRPPEEPPLVAVRNAIRETIAASHDGFGPVHLWLFSNQPRPFGAIRRFSPRPLVRLERAVADGLRARGCDDEFSADVLARAAVAVLRAAVIRSRSTAEPDDFKLAKHVDEAVVEAFAILGAHAPALTK